MSAREFFVSIFFFLSTANWLITDARSNASNVSRVDPREFRSSPRDLIIFRKVRESRYHRVSFPGKPDILNRWFRIAVSSWKRQPLLFVGLTTWQCSHARITDGVELAFCIRGYNLNRGNLERNSGLTPRNHRDVILAREIRPRSSPRVEIFSRPSRATNERETYSPATRADSNMTDSNMTLICRFALLGGVD